jgi:hypothetical protein
MNAIYDALTSKLKASVLPLVPAVSEMQHRHHEDTLFDSPLLAQGKLNLQNAAFSTQDVLHLWQLLTRAIHPIDFVFLALLSWGAVPFCGVVYDAVSRKYAYEASLLYQLVDHIAQISKLALAVYLVDCGVVILIGLGVSWENMDKITAGFAKILLITWMAQRFLKFKRYLIVQAHKNTKLGRASMIDRLLDGIIYLLTALFLLDVINVEMGIGISSVFAFGSAGTLMVG